MSCSVLPYPQFIAWTDYDTNRPADYLHVETRLKSGDVVYSRILIGDAGDHAVVLEAMGEALASLKTRAGEAA